MIATYARSIIESGNGNGDEAPASPPTTTPTLRQTVAEAPPGEG